MAEERALRPIYNAIDSHNYTKAVKLCSSKPQCDWPITIALKAHVLERCNRTLESLEALRALFTRQGCEDVDWSELDEQIWVWRVTSNELEGNGSGTSGTSTSAMVSKTKGKSGGKKGKSSAQSKQGNGPTKNVSQKNPSISDLDMIDILDMSLHERREIIRSKALISKDFKTAGHVEDIIEDTTLATIAVTMKSYRLYQTLANFYSLASSVLSKPTSSPQLSQDQTEHLFNTLVQSYLSNLRIVTNISKNPPLTSLSEKIASQKVVIHAYESAQLASMQLCRFSSSFLHISWCAHAAMEHLESCQTLLGLWKEQEKSHSVEDKEDDEFMEEMKKIEMKVGMLPRLTESLMTKVCADRDGHPPSADDWRIYIKSLVVQEKNAEAIDVIEGIKCEGGDSEGKTGKRINDENDLQNHVGSLIQLSERERLEKLAELYMKGGKIDLAFSLYGNRLLKILPDQWTYWKALLECSLLLKSNEEALQDCEEVVQHIVECQEKEGTHHPLRGPQLFRVEMLAHRARHGRDDDLKNLSQSIIDYAEIFADRASCCFQDLRPYIAFLVKSSDKKGELSNEVENILKWAATFRVENNPGKSTNDGHDESSTEKAERRKKLRAFVASVKICFEVWYQLSFQNEKSKDMLKKVDTRMKDLVPTSENMVMLWEQTLYLGSNPKEGGQKEALPGDDLILLASQLMIYSSRSEETIQKEKIIDATTVLLERARQNSPFNPYLKIASLHLYAQSYALVQTWEIFQSLGIKHIQFESCSYLILPYLIQNGMYKEAVQHAGKIINLHSSSSKDIENAICRSFENGNISKGQEMIDWQRHEMRQSLQLFEAKATIMNLAPFLKDSECSSPLGSIHGFCGNSDDLIRAQKILRDSTDIFAAPSLMNFSSIQVATRVLTEEFSDNRDLSVNDFEVLSHTEYPSQHCESIQCSHIQSILTRMVCLVKAAKAPKKGRVPKYSSGDTLEKRCHSLLSAINYADIFFKSNKCDGIYMKLRDVSLLISRVTCILSTGIDAGKPRPDDDSMNSRENKCISLLGSARQLLIESEEDIDECNTKQSLLASAIVPLLSMLETTYSLFSIFGWSKRKRKTKAAMGALADTALSVHSFVLTLQGCTELKSINSNADGIDVDRSKIVFMHVLQVLKSYDVEE